MGCRLLLCGLGLVLCACGGRVRRDPNDDEPSASAPGGSSGAPTIAGAGAGAGGTSSIAGAGAGGAPSVAGAGAASVGGGGATSTLRGCPDASWGECRQGLDLTLRFDGPSKDPSGVWAEPLQIPTYLPMTIPPDVDWTPIEPEAWDRSELPGGACVFRIHGVAPDCLGRGARLQYGACGGLGIPVVPTGYYEQPFCAQGIAPGCPTDEAWRSINAIWYAALDLSAPDSTLLVICAGICGQELMALQPQLCLHRPPAN